MNNSKWTWKYKDSNRVEWEIRASRVGKVTTQFSCDYYETEWNYSIFNVDNHTDVHCGCINTQYDQTVLLDEILADYLRSISHWALGVARYAKLGD